MIDQAHRLRQMVHNQPRVQAKRSIAIVSGKGGVGKTNVAANVSMALSQLGNTVTLLDADLGLANVDIVLGIAPSHTLADVVRGERTVAEIAHLAHGVNIIAGGSGLEELAALPQRQVSLLLQQARDIESDFFLIDTGAGLSPLVINVALAAQEIILVVTPDPTSLTDAYALVKTLVGKSNNMLLHLVINRVADSRESDQIGSHFSRVVDQFLQVKINCLGYIPEDRMLKAAVLKQQPLLRIHPSAMAARQLRKIASGLSGQQMAPMPVAAAERFFARLRSLFG